MCKDSLGRVFFVSIMRMPKEFFVVVPEFANMFRLMVFLSSC